MVLERNDLKKEGMKSFEKMKKKRILFLFYPIKKRKNVVSCYKQNLEFVRRT
jgi:hypothetical protein